MNVVYVTMQFPVPSETFLSLDVETLRTKGVNVEVLGLRPPHSDGGKLKAQRGHDGMYFRNFTFSTFLDFLKFSILNIPALLALLTWTIYINRRSLTHILKSLILIPSVGGQFYRISRVQPDVVHLFWGHYPSMVGYLVRKYLPKTVLTQFLGAHDLVANYPGSIALGRRADFVFTHSRSNLPVIHARGIPDDKIKVVYRGVDCRINNDFCEVDRVSEVKYVFLTASRLIIEKGVDDSIKVFCSFLEKHPSSVLYIAGDGPDRGKLEGLVRTLGCSDRVFFLGHVDQRKLLSRMSASDIFLFMSRYESERLPNVVKEAMFRRCLVVTTDTTGIEELVENGKSGFIVPQGDVASAVQMIESVIIDPSIQERIKANAFEIISDRFNVQRNMEQYMKLWSMASRSLEHGGSNEL